MSRVEYGLLLTVAQEAREKEKAMITHSPSVPARILFYITQVFLSDAAHYTCNIVSPSQKWYNFSAHTFLQIDLGCAMFHTVCNFVNLLLCMYRMSEKETGGRERDKGAREKERLCSRRRVWLIWLSICGTGAVLHRMKINLRFLPNGHYNYWFPNPICHTYNPHKKMWLKILAASICYIYTWFCFSPPLCWKYVFFSSFPEVLTHQTVSVWCENKIS